MFCSNCGIRLEDGMVFCPNCGTKIVWEEPKVEEAKAEEPKLEELKAEEPKTEEPKTEEPKTEEPKTEEPKTEEPKTEDPKAEEPKTEETKTEEPKTEEPKTEEPKVEETVGKARGAGILTFVLCLLLFVCGIAICFSGVLRLTYAGDKTAALMDRIDVREITIPSTAGKGELPLVDFLEEASGFDFEGTAGVSKKDLEKLLCKSYVKKMASDYVSDYVNYFFNGKKPKAFTRNDAVDFVKDHDDDFYELMNFRFTYMDPESNRRKVYTVDIDNAFRDLGTEEITVDWIEGASGIKLHIMAAVLSIPMLCGMLLASVLFFILVILLHHAKIRKGILADGMTLLLIGLVVNLAGGVSMLLLNARKTSIVTLFCMPLAKNLLLIGSPVLIIGLVFVVLAKGKGIPNTRSML